METFTLSFGGCWITRVLGRNPLLRPSDRIESLLLVLVVALALLFVPLASATGTAVHDKIARASIEESRSRHLVTATVVEDSTVTLEHRQLVVSAPVQWRVDGADRVERLKLRSSAQEGDRRDIWLDRKGNAVVAPPATWRAGADAMFAGAAVWLGLMAVVTGAAALILAGLNRRRSRSWDRDLRLLVDDDGGRTGHQN